MTKTAFKIYLMVAAILVGLVLLMWHGPVQGGQAMTDDEINLIAKDYTAAWSSREANRVAAFFAADGVLSVNGVPAAGTQAISEVVQGFMTAFPDMELFMDALDIESTKVVYHWKFVGTNNGPGGTGKKVVFRGYEEWTFGGDGLIADSQGHYDEDDYQFQLEHGFDAERP